MLQRMLLTLLLMISSVGYDGRFVLLRANLDGTIFPYDCSMRLAHVMSTTQIVSSKSHLLHVHDSHTQHEKCRRILKCFKTL